MQDNLCTPDVSMVVPIPNINWNNPTNWISMKQIFCHKFPHTRILAISSAIGLDNKYFKPGLIGGSSILTFGLWSSKVTHSSHMIEALEHAPITMTAYKNNKKSILHICLHCTTEGIQHQHGISLFTTDTIQERTRIKNGNQLSTKFRPRQHAVKQFNIMIQYLQQQWHAIIFMLDANTLALELAIYQHTQ